MVKNIALAALVGLFASATFAGTTGETGTQHPAEKDAKAGTGTETAPADGTKKEEPKKEEEKK